MSALCTLAGGEYPACIPGAPALVDGSFAELDAAGIAAATPLVARSD